MDAKQNDSFNNSKKSSTGKQQGNLNSKEELLAYIKELEQKQNAKLHLLKRNQSCVKSRPDPDSLAKLDSSLKKNTAFVKKLRNFTASQLDTFLKDCAVLNLTKYLSEVVSSLSEVKLKFTDIAAATTLCTELNCTYAEFSPIFHEQWIKTLCIKKDEPITNPRKLSIDLRFYSELIACGVFSHRESLPLLGTVLTVLTSDKKYNSLSLVISFCKNCGDDFAGLLPQRIRKLSDQFCIPVPCSTLLSTEKQANVRALFRDYYLTLSQHLQKEVKRIQTFEKQNKQLLNTKGELRQERIMKDEVLHAELQTLMAGTFNLAELLDLPPPDLPESSCCEDSSMLLDVEECVGGSIWEDEETRLFYTKFPDVQEYLPQGSQKQNAEEKVTKDVFAEPEDINKEDGFSNSNKKNAIKEEAKKEDDTVAIEEPEGSISKIALETFLKHLPNCVNKSMIDNAAIEFLLYLNSKNGRKKLIFTLFTVHRTRLDLLPLYARLVAILNPAIPEVGYNLCQQLKSEFHRHIQKKDQVNIESKIRSIRFIGELVNMQVFHKHEALQLLKQLLQDFTHHHIEMACNLLETCGRFLYRSIDSHHRTKVFLEQMMRVKSMMVLDARYVFMIENTYYLVNPPEIVPTKTRMKPVLHQFIEKVIYQDLMQPGFEPTALNLLRSLDWDCENTAAYVIKCLSSPHKIKFQRIRVLAGVVAELAEYQEFIASRIVDAVLEDIRLGMEINLPLMNQRRVAMVKYLGELYTYRLLDNGDIFKVLYSMLTFGINMDHDNPSPLDPPTSLFRIRLVIVLLESCAPFFSDFCSRQKLNCFFTYFQSYYWFKRSSPVWSKEMKFPQVMQQMFTDAMSLMCPLVKPARNYTEAQQAVKQLSNKILTDLLNNNKQNGELEQFLECIEEEEADTSKELQVHKSKSSELTLKKHTSYNEMIEDDMEFLTALDKMFLDNVRLRDKVKHSNVDISIPIAHKKELSEQDSNFVLILKKGNKQQCKSLELPPDSELLVNLKNREEEERKEMERVKQITLDISQRIQDEASTTVVDAPH